MFLPMALEAKGTAAAIVSVLGCILALTLVPPAWTQERPTAAPPRDEPLCCGQSQTLIRFQAAGETASPNQPPRRVLRISADPNNLPFTNDRLEGFENKIAELLAREMQADLLYLWRAQRRGFFRQSLTEGECDVVLGVPARFEMALTTAPYYASSYCFVYRKDKAWSIQSFDDPVLRNLKIGVQVVGDDGANPPPAHALGARGLIDNLVGYSVYGDYRQDNPPSRIVEGVAHGETDVAVVWGPLAGYFARRQPVELEVVPVSPARDRTGYPMAFSVAMGVRKDNVKLRDEINAILERQRPEIEKILDEYGVPRVAPPPRVKRADDD
jgi:quinoprotein dehydrogenase-associated probable ABC transporter substrate-binding protein